MHAGFKKTSLSLSWTNFVTFEGTWLSNFWSNFRAWRAQAYSSLLEVVTAAKIIFSKNWFAKLSRMCRWNPGSWLGNWIKKTVVMPSTIRMCSIFGCHSRLWWCHIRLSWCLRSSLCFFRLYECLNRLNGGLNWLCLCCIGRARQAGVQDSHVRHIQQRIILVHIRNARNKFPIKWARI